MPLTLNVGIAKKLGQSDFGSLGAHCNLSVELDPAVLGGDAEALQRHVRHAYAACSRASLESIQRHWHPAYRQECHKLHQTVNINFGNLFLSAAFRCSARCGASVFFQHGHPAEGRPLHPGGHVASGRPNRLKTACFDGMLR
jgi:hypothetical protein